MTKLYVGDKVEVSYSNTRFFAWVKDLNKSVVVVADEKGGLVTVARSFVVLAD